MNEKWQKCIIILHWILILPSFFGVALTQIQPIG